MNELEIRAQLIRLLQDRSGSALLPIFEEVPVSHGGARADLVTVTEELGCYEIKSEADSLKRLIRQGWHFGRAFNRITLVVATRHLENAESVIPDWWGIIEVKSPGQLQIVRDPAVNPTQITYGLSELLTRREAIQLLDESELAKGMHRKSMRIIQEKIALSYDIETLNRIVLSFFRQRQTITLAA